MTSVPVSVSIKCVCKCVRVVTRGDTQHWILFLLALVSVEASAGIQSQGPDMLFKSIFAFSGHKQHRIPSGSKINFLPHAYGRGIEKMFSP